MTLLNFPICTLSCLCPSVPVPVWRGLLSALATTLTLHTCPFASFSFRSGTWGQDSSLFKFSATGTDLPGASISRGTFWKPCLCQTERHLHSDIFWQVSQRQAGWRWSLGSSNLAVHLPGTRGLQSRVPSLVCSQLGPSLSLHSGPGCLFVPD